MSTVNEDVGANVRRAKDRRSLFKTLMEEAQVRDLDVTAEIVPGEKRVAVEQLLFEEAQYLDDFDFSNWLGLLAPDFRYFVPVRLGREVAGGAEFSENSFYYEDDVPALQMRVRRLGLPSAWAEASPSITRRLLGNIRIWSTSSGEFLVKSNCLIYRSQELPTGREVLSAERWDLVEPREKSNVFRGRVVFLDHTILPWHNLSVFV